MEALQSIQVSIVVSIAALKLANVPIVPLHLGVLIDSQ
jgi:hypothetical protein